MYMNNMARAKFDKICKQLIHDLGTQLNFFPINPYHLDPQVLIETVSGYFGEEKSLNFTIDIAWVDPLSTTGISSPWIKDVISDVVVAWEVDAGTGHKAIRSSVDNLATLNPRLGIQYILIGGNKHAIQSFERRYNTAIQAARIKPNRIVVIHDIIFAQMYHASFNTHPIQLYDEYTRIAKEKEINSIMKLKWVTTLEKTKNLTVNFIEGIFCLFLDNL